jgi:nonsense-mediated mRNA decay protein 3
MEALPTSAVPEQGVVACCECGTPIAPNPANMCVACLRSKVDITEGIPRQSNLQHCKFCERYLVPPSNWQFADPESKELLALCLRRVKPQMTAVRLVDASFIWTEPHSKRVKVKLTVQKEVFANAVLQQSFVIEYVICGQVCEECHRVQAKDYWRALVQVRQKCDYKKTLFSLEQLILKHDAAALASNVKPVPTGIDFYFAKQQDARKLIEFIHSVLPCKDTYAQQLISQDIRNNTFDYKHTYCVDICPITKDSLVCLPKKMAQSFGNLSQIVVCSRVTNVITLIDPSTLQMVDVNGLTYFKDPFEIFMGPNTMVEFYVVDEEEIHDFHRGTGHGAVSSKHQLSHVWVTRSSEVGVQDAPVFSVRTHLGKILRIGDAVMGYDLVNTNVNSPLFDKMPEGDRPDVILVRKVHQKHHNDGASTVTGMTGMTRDMDEMDLE